MGGKMCKTGIYPLALLLLLTLIVRSAAQYDHQAHAKPGGPYYAVDWDGDGMETVHLDATESHTHYFDHGPPPKSGTVVKYQWISGNTGKTILTTAKPHMSGSFFLGVTILKLIVTDNTGDSASGWTYVQVRRPHKWENKVPSVKSITPNVGPLAGGISVTITGSDFYNNPKAFFGTIAADIRVISDTKIIAIAPKSDDVESHKVTVTTAFGTSSQDVLFKYSKTAQEPVQFVKTTLKVSSGEDFSPEQITTIKIGPDGRYYAGSLDGYIYKFALNRKLVVQDWCRSAKVGKFRSVLGLAFHPHEWSTPRTYIATSQLHWKKKNLENSWDNGDVEVWTSVASADCMMFSHTLITGLPVSNHDHGVNGLEFDSNGDLFIAIGGTTNAGIYTNNDGVGGIPESPFSGAILRAKLSLGNGFDGKVTYNQKDDPGTANVVSGSVVTHGVGMRNVFALIRHSNGKLYAMDNGPNSGFGHVATSCTTMGGQVFFNDKLLNVKPGNYYGHPNRNRGRKDPRQCSYVKGDTKGLPAKQYTPPMAVIESSTSGIMEYTANTFNHQLRGNLLLSKVSWAGDGKLFRAILSKNGESTIGNPDSFLSESGLSIVMGVFGEIIMPKLKQKKIVAYIPKESMHQALRVIAVTPRKGPAGGVNPVLITGNGFWEGVQIFFDGNECQSYKSRAEDGSSIWCQVPPGKAGAGVSVTAKLGKLTSKPSGHSDYEYMGY